MQLPGLTIYLTVAFFIVVGGIVVYFNWKEKHLPKKI